ncbi:MAG TPA: class I SAM-dependent methyltransferase [Candidatus Binataceae bacterium]|nr:class I SAM-dependent methyltransferase [Candidatus Binataceae bacterium]
MPGSDKFLHLNQDLYDYVIAHGHNSDPILLDLAEETHKLGRISGMQIAPEQGTLMGLLARAIGAKSAVEVGVFTGYSSLSVARALPPDGKLLCLDVNEEWTSIARRYWERAGVANKITLKLAPAADTLRALPASRTFDFAFVDADKSNYRIYYEEILKRLRPNGLLLIDNVLWNGQVIDANDKSDDTVAIRALNDFIATDTRVEAVMIPVADGITIARKK